MKLDEIMTDLDIHDDTSVDRITPEMEKFFVDRTHIHIAKVCKYLNKIIDLNLPGVDNNILEQEKDHDANKFDPINKIPYTHISWKYKLLDDGQTHKMSDDMIKQVDAATGRHVKTNKHHPEYWDTSSTPADTKRDKPSTKIVDASKMPLTYIATMCADWLAMSDEKKTDPKKWADDNIGKRWKFTDRQIKLIYRILDAIPVGKYFSEDEIRKYATLSKNKFNKEKQRIIDNSPFKINESKRISSHQVNASHIASKMSKTDRVMALTGDCGTFAIGLIKYLQRGELRILTDVDLPEPVDLHALDASEPNIWHVYLVVDGVNIDAEGTPSDDQLYDDYVKAADYSLYSLPILS